MVMKKGDKLYVKNKLEKGVYPFLEIPAGETKEYEIKSDDDILFRAIKLGHVELVKKPKKYKKKFTSKKKVK